MSVAFRVFFLMVATVAVATGLSNRPALAQPQIYPPPTGVPLSTTFTVQIQQGAWTGSAPAYLTTKPASAKASSTPQPPFEATTAWFSFATDAPVTVQVTNQTPFQSARILPTSAGIKPVLSGSNGSAYTIASFALGGGGAQQVSVEFCYSASPCNETTQRLADIANPLLVFVNPLSANVPPTTSGQVLTAPTTGPVPALGGNQTMIYFGPGLYDLGATAYQLPSNTQAFLAGGAYVKGMFEVGDNTTIAGLGVLSGIGCTATDRKTCPMMIAAPKPPPKFTGGVTISGITLVDSQYFNILLAGTDNAVSNIKVMSWLPNTDGINMGSGTLSDSFFKVGDDAIKLYASGLKVSGCTLWHLGNAAPFELGVNLSESVSGVTVQDSDVIRTEWVFPNRSDAVFSAAFGGKATGSGYTFNNIRIENTNPQGFQADNVGSVFQLFKLAVIPNRYTTPDNDTLGAIRGVTFSNIQVSDPVTLPNLFQSFDRQNGVSGIIFDNVTVAGQTLPEPTPTYNANRNLSLKGTVFSNILWRDAAISTSFLAGVFDGKTDQPTMTSLTAPSTSLPSFLEAWAIGDVDGNGYASVLFQNTTNPKVHGFGVWDQPMLAPGRYDGILSDYLDNVAVGVGDFNGDGRSDILLWQTGSQTGTILLMNGPQVASTIAVKPTQAAQGSWSVAGVGDIDQNGRSDIILRDQGGNIDILSFTNPATPTETKLPMADFKYDGGSFSPGWTVAAVGDVRGNGYASIVWYHSASCQVGITGFAFTAPPKATTGAVLGATTPNCAGIAATGDYNGDGTMDLLLLDAKTGEQTIWYLGFYDGAGYKDGPTLPAQAGYALVP